MAWVQRESRGPIGGVTAEGLQAICECQALVGVVPRATVWLGHGPAIVPARTAEDLRMSIPTHYYKLREQWGDRKIHEWVIKVVEDEDGAVFDAYVGLDRHGRVVERSSAYGVFEGNAEGFQEDSGASVVDEDEFRRAWRAPRAPLSRPRRWLQWLNGVNDERDPLP